MTLCIQPHNKLYQSHGEEGYLLPTWTRKITWWRFDSMLQPSSGQKWRSVNKLVASFRYCRLHGVSGNELTASASRAQIHARHQRKGGSLHAVGERCILGKQSFSQEVDNTIEVSRGVTCLMACCVGGSICLFMLHLPYYTGKVVFTCSKST